MPASNIVILKEGEKPPSRDRYYEDWSTPELTRGMKVDIEPMATTSLKGFTRQLVHVQWRDFDPIYLYVIRPEGVAKPPAILYLYSYPASNAQYKDDNFCRFVTSKGFAAIGFVPAVTEERFHDRPKKEWFVSELQESLGSSAHDVQMILNYMEKRGDFDMSRIGMWGDGSGATVAILAASVDSRIKALDLLDPWGDWPNWLAGSSLVPDKERPDYLKVGFLKSVDGLDPLTILPHLQTEHVRLQHIDKGVTVTPDSVRKRLEAAVPPGATVIHYDDVKTFATEIGAKGKGFDWIKENVGSTTDAAQDAGDNLKKK